MEAEIFEEKFRKGTKQLNLNIFRGIASKKHIKAAIARGEDFYYMDSGYFGNFKNPANPKGKKWWQRIVKNELQKSKIETRPNDRWEALAGRDPRLQWRGWKKDGNKILVIVPSEKSCNYYEYSSKQWLQDTLTIIKKQTNMPIILRYKTSRPERQINSIYKQLDEGIFATVAFNSIAAMESIAYGIPAFVSVSCAASPLASGDLTQITTPHYPEPAKVYAHCCNLAYGQFTEDEMLNGTAWRLLNYEPSYKK